MLIRARSDARLRQTDRGESSSARVPKIKIKKYWKAAPFGAVVARVPLILDNAWKKASGFVPGSGGEYDYAPAQG